MPTTTIPERLAALDSVHLYAGSHADSGSMCSMEAVAWLAGEPHTDKPACACPVIAALVRRWNDALPDDDRQRLLKPLLPQLVGSKSTRDVEQRRAYMALDWLVRANAVAWLRLAGLTADADALAGLPPIADVRAATVARAAVRAAQEHAAARAAARDAAWVAARDAAGDAAMDAAGAAAMDAAAAAGAAAMDAAWVAARDAAWDAAWVAARDAAWVAARDAAGAAAMRATVASLQESAVTLVREMAALGRQS